MAQTATPLCRELFQVGKQFRYLGYEIQIERFSWTQADDQCGVRFQSVDPDIALDPRVEAMSVHDMASLYEEGQLFEINTSELEAAA